MRKVLWISYFLFAAVGGLLLSLGDDSGGALCFGICMFVSNVLLLKSETAGAAAAAAAVTAAAVAVAEAAVAAAAVAVGTAVAAVGGFAELRLRSIDVARRLALSTSKPIRTWTHFNVDYPRVWRLFSIILGERTRTRVFTPAYEEMLADYYVAQRTYRTKWARRWLALAFTVRTIVMVLDCARASGVDRIFGWFRTLIK